MRLVVNHCHKINSKSATFTTKLRTRRDETRLDSVEHNYYVYVVSFALSRYHIWITSGLVLNVIC